MLDKHQKEIVESNEQNILVVAGAGSGKTRVLTERIRYLIEKRNVKPSDIVAITFTNMAADEMKERLSDIEYLDEMFIGTIHSFANHLLRTCNEYTYDILSDEKQNELIKELIGTESKYTHLTVDRFTEYENLIQRFKNGENIDPSSISQFFDTNERMEYELITRSFDIYDEPKCVKTLCKERNILSFNELIKKAEEKITGENRIKYLFVDEYQDVGNLEDSFIQALHADNNFFVGDDWQSIYGFKGANVAIFKNYVLKSQEENSKWKCYFLNTNYRSDRDIVNFANNIIEDVENRIDKAVTSGSDEEGEVTYISADKLKDTECRAKLETLVKQIAKEKDFGKWFFLTRSRIDLNNLLDYCNKQGVPAITFSKANLTLEQQKELLNSNTVKVFTVHSAKGLEADNVFMYGNFPVNFYKPKNESKIEKSYEERRIMYVGCTRAKKNLVIFNKGWKKLVLTEEQGEKH